MTYPFSRNAKFAVRIKSELREEEGAMDSYCGQNPASDPDHCACVNVLGEKEDE